MKTKVALAMSGGVDSSVSAYLLKKAGYEVTGIFMHCWGLTGWPCTEDRDRADAIKVAEKLSVPFMVWDFEKEYKDRVMDYFYREYKAGRTPNPDSYCNREIKFGLFLERAIKELGVDFIATGHYVRIGTEEPRNEFEVALRCNLDQPRDLAKQGYTLMRGVDDTKDQSYFLYSLGQEQLVKTMFPVGSFKKDEVRKMAKKIGLHNSDKKGTSGICFIGKVDLKDFLKHEIKEKEGSVMDVDGNVVGKHKGVWFYTIGQRHGFTVDNKKLVTAGKGELVGLVLYVVRKNVERNELVIGWGKEVERNSFEAEDLSWVNPKYSASNISNLGVRIRHLGEIYKCKIFDFEKEKLKVELEESARGVAVGQNAVFYEGEVCLGGGVISF